MADDILEFLRTITDLQCNLIRKLASNPGHEKLLRLLLDEIAVTAHNSLHASACAILILDKHPDERGGKRATIRAATGYHKNNIDKISYKIVSGEKVVKEPIEEDRLGLSGWVISTGRAFLSSSDEDLHNHPHHLGKGVPTDRKLGAYLAVPMRNPRGKIIGAFKAERLVGGAPFSVQEKMLMETLARVAGRSIVHAEDVKDGKLSDSIIAWVLDVISETVAVEGELDAFLDIIVHVISAATLADSCAVFLKDVQKKTLTQRAGCGSQALRKVIRSYLLPDSEQVEKLGSTREEVPEKERIGLTAWIASTGNSFNASNLEELKKHPHHIGRFDNANFDKVEKCGAWFGLPLRVGGTIIGVLKIENVSPKEKKDDRDFSPEVQDRLVTLSQDVALAIERLKFQSRARYRVILDALPTISEILSGSLDVKTLVEKVVKAVASLFEARACALFLKEGNQLIQPSWAAYGWSQKGPQIRRYNLVDPEEIQDNPMDESGKVGLTAWIAAKKEKFTARSNLELKMHPHHLGTYDKNNFRNDEQCESFMGVPLVVGKERELLGVLKVETKMKTVDNKPEFAYFSEQDELVFQFIADSTAIAIQNARLMESRVLADRIIEKPNAYEVIRALHEFIEGRVEVVGILENTADIVNGRDESKAMIIQNLTSMLNPKFNIAILEQMIKIVDGPIKGFFKFIDEAIRGESWDCLRDLSTDQLQIAAITRKKFVLHEGAEILLEMWEKIKKELDLYENDVRKRIHLQDCIRILEKSKSEIEENNLFEKSLLDRIFTHWQEVIQANLKQFHKIPNHYILGLPVPAESPLFVGRKDIFNWIEDRLSQPSRNVLVLHGGGRTGKTSILYQLRKGPMGRNLRQRHENPIYPVFIDLQKFMDQGTCNLLMKMAATIASELKEQGINDIKLNESNFQKAHYNAFEDFLKLVSQKLSKKADASLVIMLDEFEVLDRLVLSKKVDADIFTFLRSQMQHQPSISFILAGRKHLDQLTPTYKNLIFNVAAHKIVGFLNESDAKTLICDSVINFGVHYEADVVEEILALSGCHPYFIQQLCSTCIDQLNQQKKDYTINKDILDAAVELSLKQGYRTLLEELWEDFGKEGHLIMKKLALNTSAKDPWIPIEELVEGLAGDKVEELTVRTGVSNLINYQWLDSDPSSNSKQKKCRFGMELLRLFTQQKLY